MGSYATKKPRKIAGLFGCKRWHLATPYTYFFRVISLTKWPAPAYLSMIKST